MPLHQILMGASAGDAITSMALNARSILREFGPSEIFAVFPDPSIGAEVLPIQRLDGEKGGDLLVYHASFGLPDLTSRLMQRPEEIVLCYHNVTPAHFFDEIDPDFARGLRWGKQELGVLRPRVRHAFADSTFNAQDLLDVGYASPEVLPVGIDSQKLVEFPPDIRIANHYSRLFPSGYVIAVSQLLPHKHMEMAIAVVHQLREVWGLDLGLVIVGVERSGAYASSVRGFADRLLGNHFRMTGRLNDRQLSTLQRHATIYIGTSAHEGLSVPLIDSMALGVPALVRAFGAVRETASDGALLVEPNADPVEIAKAAAALLSDEKLRRQLVSRGLNRAMAFRKEIVLDRFRTSMKRLIR